MDTGNESWFARLPPPASTNEVVVSAMNGASYRATKLPLNAGIMPFWHPSLTSYSKLLLVAYCALPSFDCCV